MSPQAAVGRVYSSAAENGFTANDVDQLLFTQISKPSIVIAAERCGVPVEKCALFATHLRTPGLHGVHARRLEGASGCNDPTGYISAVGLEGRADEALQVAALQDSGAGSVAPQKAARIVRIGEPMNRLRRSQESSL
jgi:hypothetical protein